MKFLLKSKTNKNKSIEICPPLLLKPTDVCAMRMCNAESPKRSVKRFQFMRRRQGFDPLEVITVWVYSFILKRMLRWLTGDSSATTT